MNELIQPEFELLTDCVPVDQRPALAALMDRVEEYEAGNFSGSLDYLDLFAAIRRDSDDGFIRALSALLRIVRYCAEIMRASCLSDSTVEETRT
jgi:hypothetical protein